MTDPRSDPLPTDSDETKFRPSEPVRAIVSEDSDDATRMRPASSDSEEEVTRLARPSSGAPRSAVTDSEGAAADNKSSPRTGGSTGQSWGDPAQWAQGDSRELRPGDVVKDRFVLEDVIGKGGMGVVFRARDLRKEEAQDRHPYAALKVLNEHFKLHPESLKALQREARKAQNLAHPNIVTVYDFDRDGANVYMVMELLEGEPLDRLIKQMNGTGLAIAKALPIIRALCGALSYAHEHGVVHSDFKPANAFVTRSGAIKVFDFGIARAAKRQDDLGQGGLDQTGGKTLFDAGTLGALTPAYASCEMIEGGEPDPRDDVYALGCVAYELLTGKHPFGGKPATQARDAKLKPKAIRGLTRRQWRGVRRALAFERSARIASVTKFLEEISPQKRSPAVWIGIAAAVLVLGVAATQLVPDYLQRRRVEAVVMLMRSDAPGSVEQALPLIQALSPDARAAMLLDEDLRSRLIGHFNSQIEAATASSGQEYDYPQAELLVAELQRLFPDSQTVSQIGERLKRLADLVELRQKLLDQAAANKVDEAAASLRELRAGLPANDPFLNDAAPKAMTDAYVRLAGIAARDGRFEAAVSLIDRALEFDGTNAQTVALREKYSQSLAAAHSSALAKTAAQAPAAVSAPPSAPPTEPSATQVAPSVATPTREAAATPAPTAVATSTAAANTSSCNAGLAGYGTRSRGVCFDALPTGRGPELVVIPAGGSVARPFAIGRYEVSTAEYAAFCQQSQKCRSSGAQADLPVTAIAAADAQRYAEWLSATTGFTYRMPTDSEWVYAADAPGGSTERNFNCVVEIGGQKIRGFALASVRSGRPNGWGLYNQVGNAQEWVKAGDGWSARGGAFSDAISQCSTTLNRASAGAADAATGFRVLRELK